MAARLAALGVSQGDRVVLAGAEPPGLGRSPTSASCAPGPPPSRSIPALDAVASPTCSREPARAVVWDDTVKARASVAGAHAQLDLHEATGDTTHGAGRRPPSTSREDDVASLIYTSGTTGQAQGRHAHARELHVARRGARRRSSRSRAATRCSACCRCTTRSSSRAACCCRSRAARASCTSTSSRATASRERPRRRRGRPRWSACPRSGSSSSGASCSRSTRAGRSRRAPFDVAGEANRWLLGERSGSTPGKVLFGAGARRARRPLKWLISGGAALPKETQERFARPRAAAHGGLRAHGGRARAHRRRARQKRAAGRGQARPGRRAAHRQPRRARHRRGARARPERDGGLHRRRGDRAHDRRRGLAAHGRPRAARQARPARDRRPPQGRRRRADRRERLPRRRRAAPRRRAAASRELAVVGVDGPAAASGSRASRCRRQTQG